MYSATSLGTAFIWELEPRKPALNMLCDLKRTLKPESQLQHLFTSNQ